VSDPVRVGLAFLGDPADPGAWSGIPAGLMEGLAATGCEVVGVSAELARPVRAAALALALARTRSRLDAGYGPALARARSAAGSRRLRRARPLQGMLQIGSEYELSGSEPVAVMADMTLAQARRVHPVFSRLSDRVFGDWQERQRRIWHAARACVVASRWTADSVVEDYGVPRERVHVVGFGANHRPSPADRDWREPRFLFIGREWERKNGPLLLRVFARLREEHPDARLDLVGGHPPLSEPGVAAHGELSLRDAGERRRMEELLATATCFVMPSSCEPLGIVHIEAGLAGVPSIGTTVGGSPEFISPDAGLVVAPGDEEGLLDAMRHLADPDTARRMGEAARQRAELFTWEKVAERILRALRLPAPDGRPLAAFLG
jgi:Glycosyl transferases group 1